MRYGGVVLRSVFRAPSGMAELFLRRHLCDVLMFDGCDCSSSSAAMRIGGLCILYSLLTAFMMVPLKNKTALPVFPVPVIPNTLYHFLVNVLEQ